MSNVILTTAGAMEGQVIVWRTKEHIYLKDWYCDLDVGTTIIYNAKKLLIDANGHIDMEGNFRRTRVLIKTINFAYLVDVCVSYRNLERFLHFTVLRTFHA
jgi:hypothetical protein